MPIFHEQVEESASPFAMRHRPDLADCERHCQYQPLDNARERTPTKHRSDENRPLSRGELIERLKRRESPSWTIRHGFGRKSLEQIAHLQSSPPQSPTTSLLPAVQLRESVAQAHQELEVDHNTAGLQIERPRSALHSGDFREEKDLDTRRESSAPSLATSPVVPWHSEFPSFLGGRSFDSRPPSHSRPILQSALSNFTLLPPTSPLVQASYNSDLDFSPKPLPRRSGSPPKDNRRHTFSPQSFQNLRTLPFSGSEASSPRPQASSRREGTYPYQAHQPWRSVTSSNQLNSVSTPQTPLLRPRGASNASDLSPLHHAPMVGSYEESILRGRMSTTPSRPLNFVAQIGVLGKGKCKASLKCPPHVIVPFPAVFYSYGTSGGRMAMDNQPSPYVGLIDLENSLSPAQDNEDLGRRRRKYASPTKKQEESVGSCQNSSPSGCIAQAEALRRKKERLKRRSESPIAPPGGSYRIPQQGQLQIILKNPNKTAVKLFLVPYNLSDMEPGQKTFIRQRSYSAGPIIDMPMSARTNLGTDRPEASLSHSEDPRDRPVLRYLIHLNICCPSKGRYYLYKAVRVVFANRVPDGKERLRNEVQLPDPRYSAYKPQRDIPQSTTTLVTDKAFRRRSTPFTYMQNNPDSTDGLGWSGRAFAETHATSPIRSYTNTAMTSPVRPIPFTLTNLETLESRPGSREQMDLDSPFSSRSNRENTESADLSSTWMEKRKSPLSSAGSSVASGISAGLLARRFRGVSLEREDD